MICSVFASMHIFVFAFQAERALGYMLNKSSSTRSQCKAQTEITIHIHKLNQASRTMERLFQTLICSTLTVK